MRSYLVDILWHGGMWATFMIFIMRLWRGRTWKETIGVFFWLAFVYGSIRHASEPFLRAIGWWVE